MLMVPVVRLNVYIFLHISDIEYVTIVLNIAHGVLSRLFASCHFVIAIVEVVFHVVVFIVVFYTLS